MLTQICVLTQICYLLQQIISRPVCRYFAGFLQILLKRETCQSYSWSGNLYSILQPQKQYFIHSKTLFTIIICNICTTRSLFGETLIDFKNCENVLQTKNAPIVNSLNKRPRFAELFTQFDFVDNQPNCKDKCIFNINTPANVFMSQTSNTFHSLLKQLSPYQYMNRIPGSTAFSKDILAHAVNYQMQFAPLNLTPDTFILPEHKNKVLQMKNQTVIQKPINGMKGKGIKIGTVDQIDLNMSSVVQIYENTLLYNKHKFDLRYYVLITSVDPLICYYYQNGDVRVAKKLYTESNFDDPQIHLTNGYVNNQNEDANYKTDSGDFGSFNTSTLFKYLEQSPRIFGQDSINTTQLQLKIEETITKTLISVYPELVHFSKPVRLHRFPKTMFQIFGFDLFITPELDVKLFEVNTNPGFYRVNNIHPDFNGNEVVNDALQLIGVRINVNESNINIPVLNQKDLFIKETYTKEEDLELIDYSSATIFEKKCVQQIMDEETRIGGFTRIKFENYLNEFRDGTALTNTVYKIVQQGLPIVE
ncbi:Tubulin_tyrosine ligase [Hexamita inflata]|uniref:Tubulin tyrosine ligase n=1 Tax=Hexamita inflata TaxID=28002 RepID=A0AA86RSK6_9EUKA|nr:Tubulin tyrosine ligase [Hexamita inflata]